MNDHVYFGTHQEAFAKIMDKETMHQTTNKQDYSELKSLLNSWNLRELFDYFQDEGINIEELLLMKFHHIDQVLKHFKYGIRIRFEHYLEHWRSAQNRPLVLPFSSYATDNHHSYYDSMIDPVRNSHAACNGISSFGCKEALIENLLSPNFLPSEPFVALTELEPDMKQYAPQHDMLLTNGSRSSSDNGETAIVNPNVLNSDITVKYILLNSGPKGSALYDFRLENQPLTQAQRTLLIQLIVNYFELHDLHLSLTLSHLLENQILNIFPKEELSFYRTEKRGKIYVKFTNMKRYKRDRPTKSRRSDSILLNFHKLNTSIAAKTKEDELSEKKRFKLEDIINSTPINHNE